MKKIIITEKPSVAREFASVLGTFKKEDGFLGNSEYIITWCIGHLVTLCYPEAYDPNLKKWTMASLPFIPDKYKYQVIEKVEKQFKIVKTILNRNDVDTVYYAGDSAREGEYIQRLVRELSLPKNHSLIEKRIWIDSQTEEEILKGIKNAKPLSEYDALSDSAYMRAIEDYLVGINYSRAISLKYNLLLNQIAGTKDKHAIPVGRVMSCVLGMVTEKERSIRNFTKTPFFGILGSIKYENTIVEPEWKAVSSSKYFESPLLYKETGFKEKKDAASLQSNFQSNPQIRLVKKDIVPENKFAPLLFNLAELQNECSKLFKISPDETLKIVQKLYESKITTYPRTDARVITSSVASEIDKNIKGLSREATLSGFCSEILSNSWHLNLSATKYVDDKAVSDHYAIIPTGQGVDKLSFLTALEKSVFELIAKRFISIFYPPAKFLKTNLVFENLGEMFFLSDKTLMDVGFFAVTGESQNEKGKLDPNFVNNIKINDVFSSEFNLKESETSPPKPYTSGSIILAMENAGQLIEDDELRAEIKGSGIGTSATRAEIINKLLKLEYVSLNKKTQRLSSTKLGEVVFEILKLNTPSILSPAMTANWEKGLSMISKKEIEKDFFYQKLLSNINNEMAHIMNSDFSNEIRENCKTIISHFGETIENSNIEPLADKNSSELVCPICKKHHMIERDWGFGCSGYSDQSCKFSVGFNIGDKYGVKVSKSQIKKLIKSGRTDFYEDLKSEKGKFKARFIIKNGGYIGFEFEKRKAN